MNNNSLIVMFIMSLFNSVNIRLYIMIKIPNIFSTVKKQKQLFDAKVK